MVVGVDERVVAARPAEDFGGAIGEHLVGVHVVRGARARLVDVDHELVAQSSPANLVGRSNDSGRHAFIKPSERLVGFGSRPFNEHRRDNEIGGCPQVTDAEIVDGSRGLDAVVRVGGDLVFTERIALGSKLHWIRRTNYTCGI